jgi:hypothetical protein
LPSLGNIPLHFDDGGGAAQALGAVSRARDDRPFNCRGG